MSSRKAFLATLSVTGTSVALASSVSSVRAQTPPPDAPASAAPATPAEAARPSKISEAARAQATAMRHFDPALTDAEIETIARGIDDLNGAGKALHGGRVALHNGDEPVTHFFVPVDGTHA